MSPGPSGIGRIKTSSKGRPKRSSKHLILKSSALTTLSTMNEELGTEHNFPNRLMVLLEDEEVQKAMHWLPDGRTFVIANPTTFDELVLKRHFNSVKFDSFIVRLRKWGFKRIDEKVNGRYLTFTFTAELFRRDQPHLCNKMALRKYKQKAKEKEKEDPSPSSKSGSSSDTKKGNVQQQQMVPVQVSPPFPSPFGFNYGMNPMMIPAWQNAFWQNSPFAVMSTGAEREEGLSMLEAATNPKRKQQQPRKKRAKSSNRKNSRETSQQQQQLAQRSSPENAQLLTSENVDASLKSTGSFTPETSRVTRNSVDIHVSNTPRVANRRQLKTGVMASQPMLKATTPPVTRKEPPDRHFNRMSSEPVFPSHARAFSPLPPFPMEPTADKTGFTKHSPLPKSMSYDQPPRQFPSPHRHPMSYDHGHQDRPHENPVFLNSFAANEGEEILGACDFYGQDWEKAAILERRQDDIARNPMGGYGQGDAFGVRYRSNTDPTENRGLVMMAGKSDNHGFQAMHEIKPMPQVITFPADGKDEEQTERVKAADLFQDVAITDVSPTIGQYDMMQQFHEHNLAAAQGKFIVGGGDVRMNSSPDSFALVDIEESGQKPEFINKAVSETLARKVTRVETPIKSIAKSTEVLGIPEEPPRFRNEIINTHYSNSVAVTNAHLRNMKQHRFTMPTQPQEREAEALHGGSLASDNSGADDLDLNSLSSLGNNQARDSNFIDYFLEQNLKSRKK